MKTQSLTQPLSLALMEPGLSDSTEMRGKCLPWGCSGRLSLQIWPISNTLKGGKPK